MLIMKLVQHLGKFVPFARIDFMINSGGEGGLRSDVDHEVQDGQTGSTATKGGHFSARVS
jgi:hypothetical protein